MLDVSHQQKTVACVDPARQWPGWRFEKGDVRSLLHVAAGEDRHHDRRVDLIRIVQVVVGKEYVVERVILWVEHQPVESGRNW